MPRADRPPDARRSAHPRPRSACADRAGRFRPAAAGSRHLPSRLRNPRRIDPSRASTSTEASRARASDGAGNASHRVAASTDALPAAAIAAASHRRHRGGGPPRRVSNSPPDGSARATSQLPRLLLILQRNISCAMSLPALGGRKSPGRRCACRPRSGNACSAFRQENIRRRCSTPRSEFALCVTRLSHQYGFCKMRFSPLPAHREMAVSVPRAFAVAACSSLPEFGLQPVAADLLTRLSFRFGWFAGLRHLPGLGCARFQSGH